RAAAGAGKLRGLRRAFAAGVLPSPGHLPMSSSSQAGDAAPITRRDELVAVPASGEKPRADWRIGTEHEKFGFRLDDLRPPTFDGERGIEALLKGLARYDWNEVQEGGRTVALSRNGASVTLEPAGQLEL